MSREIEPITDHAAFIGRLQQAWDTGFSTVTSEPPRRLGRSEHYQEIPSGVQNPYWEAVRWLPLESWSSFDSNHPAEVSMYIKLDGYRDILPVRDMLTKTYAWAIPTPGDIAWMKSQLDGRGVVEIGAGTGYWAWQLAQVGVEVMAFDEQPGGNHWCGPERFHGIYKGGPDVLSEAHYDWALFLCWPPYKSYMAERALRLYKGGTLFYAGEPGGGCCADDGFFTLLESEWEEVSESPSHATYSGIHCYLTMYRRK